MLTLGVLGEYARMKSLELILKCTSNRTPARFLKQIFDINIVWDEFNTFYCKCDPAVGVRCSSTRLERSFLLLILSLMLHILNS